MRHSLHIHVFITVQQLVSFADQKYGTSLPTVCSCVCGALAPSGDGLGTKLVCAACMLCSTDHLITIYLTDRPRNTLNSKGQK